jgi:hypothetical protein
MKQMGLKPGDQVKLFFNGDRVSMAPVKEDDLMRGQVAIEGADRVTFAKLKAAFMEGVSNVKLKADYESAVKLVSDLRREVSPLLFIGKPGSEYHTLVFPEIHVNYNELVVKLCELFSKITRRDGDLNVLLLDFKHTVLLLIRLLKIKCYEDSLNLPDALDIVLYANILSELVDLFVERGSEFDEYTWEIVVSLAEQYINDDLETAIRVCSGILVKADKLPLQIQKYVSSLIDLIFRKCIRDRACRCRHFYPKI